MNKYEELFDLWMENTYGGDRAEDMKRLKDEIVLLMEAAANMKKR